MVVYLADHLQPKLRPRYVTAVEERVFVEGPDREIIPDVWLRRSLLETRGGLALAEGDAPEVVRVPLLEVREAYVEILDRQSGLRVVTVIEVVSPTNKYAGPGRESYGEKQKEVLASQAHLVEIDLLRTGPHVLSVSQSVARSKGAYDYLVCVNRAKQPRDEFELYRRGLHERLPRIRIPLAAGDPDVILDLQAVLDQTYEAGSYADRLDYSGPCVPHLSPEHQAWANERIQQARREAQS
jgi:hypothetical protein